ncbi:MAG: hypothetical protein ACI4PF_01140 [Christensenellales bacterium]
MEKFYYERPNFLGSEVGLTLKTITISSKSTNYVMENNRKIVKAGTVFTTPMYGLLYQDADITDGDVIRPLMIGGRYIPENLPEEVAEATAVKFEAQGLFPITYGEVFRPNFGTAGVPQLPKPTVSNTNLVINITAVNGAIGYVIYNSSKERIAEITTTTYTTKAAGTYYVSAKGDNINYKSSELASVITVAA